MAAVEAGSVSLILTSYPTQASKLSCRLVHREVLADRGGLSPEATAGRGEVGFKARSLSQNVKRKLRPGWDGLLPSKRVHFVEWQDLSRSPLSLPGGGGGGGEASKALPRSCREGGAFSVCKLPWQESIAIEAFAPQGVEAHVGAQADLPKHSPRHTVVRKTAGSDRHAVRISMERLRLLSNQHAVKAESALPPNQLLPSNHLAVEAVSAHHLCRLVEGLLPNLLAVRAEPAHPLSPLRKGLRSNQLAVGAESTPSPNQLAEGAGSVQGQPEEEGAG